MSNPFRAIRQLEILFLDNRRRFPNHRIELVEKISTIYYWPDRQIVEVIPHNSEETKK